VVTIFFSISSGSSRRKNYVPPQGSILLSRMRIEQAIEIITWEDQSDRSRRTAAAFFEIR
jgi:hypothetical protein